MVSNHRLALVIFALVLAFGCTKGGPTAPGGQPPSVPVPVPPSAGLEPPTLGTTQRLMDPAGNPSMMTVRIMSVTPTRGSAVLLGPQGGQSDRFQSLSEICMDAGEIPEHSAIIVLYFSNDGITYDEKDGVVGGLAPSGSCATIGGNNLSLFPSGFAPKWLVIAGRHFWGQNNPDFKTGTTRFQLDYKARA